MKSQSPDGSTMTAIDSCFVPAGFCDLEVGRGKLRAGDQGEKRRERGREVERERGRERVRGRKREGGANREKKNGSGKKRRREAEKTIDSAAEAGSGLETVMSVMWVCGGQGMLLARLKAFHNFVLSCQALS